MPIRSALVSPSRSAYPGALQRYRYAVADVCTHASRRPTGGEGAPVSALPLLPIDVTPPSNGKISAVLVADDEPSGK
jgi:hypothetical protein